MVAEVVDSVSQLESRARDLARLIDVKTQTIDSRIPLLQHEISTLPVERLLDRLSLGARNEQQLWALLEDRVRVTRMILLERGVQNSSETSPFVRLQDQVTASQAELDAFRHAARHGFLPENILHQRERDHRKLVVQYQEMAAQQIAEAGPILLAQDTPSRNSDRRRRRRRLDKVASGDNSSPIHPIDLRPLSENPATGEVTGLETNPVTNPVNFVRRENKGWIYSVILPGGMQIEIKGKRLARCLEVMLKENRYLTTRQITELGWEGLLKNNKPATRQALSEIAELVAETGHVLDKQDTIEPKTNRPVMGFLIKQRQVSPTTAASELGQVTEPIMKDLGQMPFEDAVVSGGEEITDGPVGAEIPVGGLAVDAGVVLKATSETVIENSETRKEDVEPLPGVKVPNTPGLPIGAVVRPAQEAVAPPVNFTEADNAPVLNIFAKPKAVSSNVRYIGPGSDYPGYIALRTLATEYIGNEELLEIARRENLAPDQLVDGMIRQISDLLFQSRLGNRMHIEKLNLIAYLKSGFKGKSDPEIVQAYRQMLTESLSSTNHVDNSDVRGSKSQQEESPFTQAEITASGIKRDIVLKRPGYVGLQVWILDGGIPPAELARIASGDKPYDKEAVINGMVLELSQLLLRRQRNPNLLSLEQQAIIQGAQDGLPKNLTDQELLVAIRTVLNSILDGVELTPPELEETKNKGEIKERFDSDLEDKVRIFISKLHGKSTEGFVTMKVARSADGSFGPQRLEQLKREAKLQAAIYGQQELYSVLDLLNVHFEGGVSKEVMDEILTFAKKELGLNS